MAFKLYPEQEEALSKLKSGSILCGKVGSGKTLTALSFYFRNYRERKLFVITTAKKRNDHDWENEAKLVGIENITVDSWNNISKYSSVKDSFVIFDEQRVGGYGKWSKQFIKIAKANKWILLSATPGDKWVEYISVFIANGFYRNKTQFEEEHIIYDRFATYPKIKMYIDEGYLYQLRKSIIVTMKDKRKTKRHRHYIFCDYNKSDYDECLNKRWNIFKQQPITNASELTQCCRKVVNASDSRKQELKELLTVCDRVVIFYNYDYELEIIESVCNELQKSYSEWNGHRHQDIKRGSDWAYIVHYAAAEGWNCIATNKMIFYSLNYSYKMVEQAEGRIDRLNTSYSDLHYYYLTSRSTIDTAIKKAVEGKKIFNEKIWGDSNGINLSKTS